MAIRPHIAARKVHKWLGLFIGAQVVIWSLSGLYMTIVHIDTIHGDHLISRQPARAIDARQLTDPLAVAAANESRFLRLAWLRNQPVFVVRSAGQEHVVDALTGRVAARPGEQEIRAIAKSTYAGRDPIASVQLITEIPGEIRGHNPPLWRVEFDHWDRPTFYFSTLTGELVSRRHELWRVFDFLWMLHIMDYGERENVNNPLLRAFTWGAVLMALSGAWLLLFAFPKKKKKKSVRA